MEKIHSSSDYAIYILNPEIFIVSTGYREIVKFMVVHRLGNQEYGHRDPSLGR
jgi:hypothetical protein